MKKGTLNFLTAGHDAPLADGGLRFSKTMLVERIEEHEEFKRLFKIDGGVLGRITKTMKESGFDSSQPVHVWHTHGAEGEHWYLIDGYTRFTACAAAGITRIPVHEHTFETFAEAYKYVLSLQVNRRNLDSDELLKNVSLLLGSDEVNGYGGDKAELIAGSLGISKRTAQRAISLEKNADEGLLEAVRSGELSVNKAYNRMQDERGKAKCRESRSREERGCSRSDVRNIVLYVLARVCEGLTPERIADDEGLRKVLENPVGFMLAEKDRAVLDAIGVRCEKIGGYGNGLQE